MTPSRIFLYLCLSFLLGILFDSIVSFPQILILGILILGLFFISVLWNKKRFILLGCCFLFLILGVWRHQAALSFIEHPLEKEVSFIAIVSAEPDVREKNTRLTVREISPESIPGKILLIIDKYPEYQYGDKLRIKGNLQLPVIFDDFNYREYLAKDSIYSLIYNPQIELLDKEATGPFSFIYGKILFFKDKLRKSINRGLSPPQSSILTAMILGDKSSLSNDLKEKLNAAGLRHITAISGMHITIISAIVMQLLLGIGLHKRKAFYLTLTLLFLFIVMIGLPPSAVRAGIMVSVFLLARYLGRLSSSLRLVVFTAVFMLAINPLLKSDVGFQLSFLAVIGIIILGPHIKHWLRKIPDQGFLNLRSILAMTLSAQIFTLPVLVFNFGQISLLAPLANILVLSLLPFILAGGFVAALIGLLLQPLSGILFWPIWLLLTYILKISEYFFNLPFAFLNF